MKKEDADQLIRCVKECWWRLTVFFAAELLFVTLVVYGWPKGDWGLGWGAVGAVGTLVTGVGAIYIAYVQKKWIEDERNSDILKIENKLIPALVNLSIFVYKKESVLSFGNYKNIKGIDFINLFHLNLDGHLDVIEEVYLDERSRRLKSNVIKAMYDVLAIKKAIKKAYEMNANPGSFQYGLKVYLENTENMGNIFFNALLIIFDEYSDRISDCFKPGVNYKNL